MLACDWIITSARRRLVAAWSSTRLNSANTAADSPDTRQREIVGGKRRSMNRSDIRAVANGSVGPAMAGPIIEPANCIFFFS